MSSAIAAAVGATVVGSALSRGSRKAADRANNAAADAAGLQAQIADEQWGRYLETFAPLEDQMVKDAKSYTSPENYALAAGEAASTVASQFGKARDRLYRTPGLDPSSGAFQAGMVGLDLAQAATDATQQNLARKQVRDTGYARIQDAVSLGKGIPASASASLTNTALINSRIGQNMTDRADRTAGLVGGVVDRVVNSPGVNNWLGNAGVRAATAWNLNNNGGFGTGNDFGNADMGAFL